MSARQRACRQPCPGPPGNDDFLNCENSTVSTTTAPGTCKPAQQGHRSPCLRRTGESRWSEQSGPWDKPLRHDREICTTCKQGRRPPCTATGENQWSERLPVRHDRDVDDLDETATAETPQFAVRRTRIDHRIRKSSLHVGKREILPKKPRKLMPNMYPLLNQEEC